MRGFSPPGNGSKGNLLSVRQGLPDPMKLIKQRHPRDCALCVVAMLTGRSYEQVLLHNPDFENQTDEKWIEYLRSTGRTVRRTRLILPAHSYFCIVLATPKDSARNSHAIAVNEDSLVFDPATNAPQPGLLSVEWYNTSPRSLHYIHVVDPGPENKGTGRG